MSPLKHGSRMNLKEAEGGLQMVGGGGEGGQFLLKTGGAKGELHFQQISHGLPLQQVSRLQLLQLPC